MVRCSRTSSLMTAFFAIALPASGSLALTPAGIADGFTLSTFVSGYSAQYGPLAQGNLSNGNILTGSLLNQQIYTFSDVDGQLLSNHVGAVPYTCQTGNCNYAVTTAGGEVYGAQLQGGTYVHFASNGTSTPIPNLVTANLFDNLGMWGDPVNGHIISSSNRGLVDIDPVAGTYRVINANADADGVSISPDGSVVYAEVGGTIQSFNYTTGALIHTYTVGHSPDGTGVISGGSFNGDVIVNNNDGTVGLLDPGTAIFTIIASGGTRGDFVSIDNNNGTLFLSQTDQVARLTCGPDCSFSSGPPSSTPEPVSAVLFGTGLWALLWLRRRFV